MVKLIDKDPLVAEIESRVKNLTHEMSKFYYASNYNEWKIIVNEYKSLMSFINTLEVKEVDLDQELNTEWNKCKSVDEGMGCEFANISIEQFGEIAKHFFELGLKAKQD